MQLDTLARQIKRWGREVGFQQIGITGADLSEDEAHLLSWLGRDMHGEMSYMLKHGIKRCRPAQLVPGTISIISARMDYHPPQSKPAEEVLDNDALAFISRYALGRDYHKVLRSRLRALVRKIQGVIGPFGHRVFTDSAPVLEKALARNAGLGWIGKHTNLLNTKAGSWFFIGEIYTSLPLPVDERFHHEHCGACKACIDVCPTEAIIGPYQLDARRCISYLTIELRGPIPEAFRKKIGNRIYGCDDCQLVCPWNKYANISKEEDYKTRHRLDEISLIECFMWSEADFNRNTEGSAIRRIGYVCWLRNVAVALGNATTSDQVIQALKSREHHPSELVREHVGWALEQHVPPRSPK